MADKNYSPPTNIYSPPSEYMFAADEYIFAEGEYKITPYFRTFISLVSPIYPPRLKANAGMLCQIICRIVPQRIHLRMIQVNWFQTTLLAGSIHLSCFRHRKSV